MLKKVLKYTAIGIVLIVGIFLCYIFLSPRAFKARKNVSNSEKLEIGMTKEEVIKIMGEPDQIIGSYLDDSCKIYFYEPPFGASDGIDVYITPSGIVIRIAPLQ
jgi:hypothetical protein